MKLLVLVLSTLALASAAPVENIDYAPPQYRLQAINKQTGEPLSDNAYLSSYHTGAGLSDAVVNADGEHGIKGFLNETNVTSGMFAYYNQLFDLGNAFNWALVMVPNDTPYSGWQPVEIHAGDSGDDYDVVGFFINETGLQWSSSYQAPGSVVDSFGGWLVCDWWHGVPQLFFRLAQWNEAESTPSSCTDVYLIPDYI